MQLYAINQLKKHGPTQDVRKAFSIKCEDFLE